MKRNGIGTRKRSAAALAWAWALLAAWTTWGGLDARPRVAFDRPNGFVLAAGENATVTARVENGGGYWFGTNAWTGDNGGHPCPVDPAVFELDTSAPGIYLLRVAGGCDATDETIRGLLRFRVLPSPSPAARARSGETPLWSEDFTGIQNGTELTTPFHGWTGGKAFGCITNGNSCVVVGSGKYSGCVTSPPLALDGRLGRVEFSLWNYESDATAVSLESSSDAGSTWTHLATYTNLPAAAASFGEDLPAATSLLLRWRNAGSKQRFYLDDVSAWAGETPPADPRPPFIDLDPPETAVVLILGETSEIEVTATDVDGDAVTLSAPTLPDGAEWIAENTGTNSSFGVFRWTPATTGTCTAVFSASDPNDGATTVTVTFTVVPENPGTLSFASDAFRFRESGGAATLTVVRRYGSVGPVGVSWATANSSARAGTDYTATTGTLSFADGETAKTFAVPLLDNAAAQTNRAFTVALSSPTGGALLGSPSACTVTIVDDDDPHADYYADCHKNGVLLAGDALKAALCRIVNTGARTHEYSEVGSILAVVDKPAGASQVRCIYAQTDVSSYNKEHLWAQSHGIDENLPGYSDVHHIRACTESLNSARASRDFDNCRQVAGASTIGSCHYTSTAFEPPDAAKGDVARACFYMATRYQGKYGANANLELVDFVGTSSDGNQLGRLSTLLDWNELDPPDDFERTRNDKIFNTYQYNRNPFVDHPEWVRAVFDTNYVAETVAWTLCATVAGDGGGWVNSHDSSFAVVVSNGARQSFTIVPDTSAYCHIGSVAVDGAEIPPTAYSQAASYTVKWDNVTNNAFLDVRFDLDLAPLGTPIAWLAALGYTAGDGWDAAELADFNQDGIPNWQEYLNGTDPTTVALEQVTGVAVSATNAKSFTATWSAVPNATAYRLEAWTEGTGETVPATNATILFSTHFESVTGNGNTPLAANFIDGWTFTNAYRATNEIRVGSGTPGYVASAPVGATGTVRIVTKARPWGTDDSVMWVGVAGCESQSVPLGGQSAVHTNWFEGVSGEVAVCWSNAAAKNRFFLQSVEIAEIRSGGAQPEGGTAPVPGYDGLEVSGLSCTVTGLTAATEYAFRVRAEAGKTVGAWSETATVTTKTGDDPPATAQDHYELWLEDRGLSAAAAGLEYAGAGVDDFDNDGATNWQEYLADTNPADSNQHFAVTATMDATGAIRLTSDSFSEARRYTLLVYTNLDSEPSGTALGAGSKGMTVTNSLPTTGFLRLQVALPE